MVYILFLYDSEGPTKIFGLEFKKKGLHIWYNLFHSIYFLKFSLETDLWFAISPRTSKTGFSE